MRVVDYSANYIGIDKTLEKFKYLWKLEDPEWVGERKSQAKFIAKKLKSNGNSAATIREYTSYFLSGEMTGFIDESYKFFMTPIDSAETARLVFESQLFARDQRKTLYGLYATLDFRFCPEIDWLEDHVVYFIQGILGESFEEIQQEHNGHQYKISPSPASWCKQYVDSAIDLFEGQDGYYGCVDCLPYFISALPHVINEKFRNKTDLGLMFELAEEVTNQKDAMPRALRFAESVVRSQSKIKEAWAVNA